MAYPGGKGNVYQKIINQIPPHRVYIETHAGEAAVARHKRPACQNILIDLDPDVITAARAALATNGDGDQLVTSKLHDYAHLGNNFRERERIKRKKARWVKRLKKMPLLERQAILAAIASIYDDTHNSF